MLNVEEQTTRIEQLYRQLTGNEPRREVLAPIPDDANAEEYVRENLRRLDAALHAGVFSGGAQPWPVVAPRVAVSQKADQWCCQVELPGVRKAEVTLRLQPGVLRVVAIRRAPENELKGHQLLYSELRACRFERVVTVPLTVHAEDAEAQFENGLLTVRIPMENPATGKEIEIGVA